MSHALNPPSGKETSDAVTSVASLLEMLDFEPPDFSKSPLLSGGGVASRFGEWSIVDVNVVAKYRRAERDVKEGQTDVELGSKAGAWPWPCRGTQG